VVVGIEVATNAFLRRGEEERNGRRSFYEGAWEGLEK
jgi:hypothetical protein